MIAVFQIPCDRFSCLATDGLTIQLMPGRDTVLKMMTAPGRLEEVVASLATTSRKTGGLRHVEHTVEGNSIRVTEKVAFPSSALSVVRSSQLTLSRRGHVRQTTCARQNHGARDRCRICEETVPGSVYAA